MTNETYIVVREAIKAVAEQEGKLFPKEQQSHYFALAALAALEKAGYPYSKGACCLARRPLSTHCGHWRCIYCPSPIKYRLHLKAGS